MMFMTYLSRKVQKAIESGICFIEARGKDISYPRWRITVYYHPSHAATLLLEEDQYNRWLERHPNQYTWEEFRSLFLDKRGFLKDAFPMTV